MADSTLSQFTTFWESTASTYKTGLEEMVNEAVKNTYTYPRLQSAHSMEDIVQGGTNIKDRVLFKVTDLSQRINPDAELSYENPQSGVDTTAPWSILVTHTSWNKWEKSLNEISNATGDYKAHVFKKVRRQKFQEMYTALHNKLDAEMWAAPDADTMESSTGDNTLAPYSIPTFITEESDGLPVGWSGNIQNIDTTAANVDGKWDNQRQGYTFDENGTGTGDYGGHLFVAMSKLMRQCSFDRLPKNPEYSERTTTPHFIGCSLEGIAMYEAALRENQDEFRVGAQDPSYPNPLFRGIPLDYISELDTAAIYNNGSDVGATEQACDIFGPRYFFINGEYLRCFFHEDSYFEMLDLITPEKQPFNRVQLVDVTNNLFCRSRQRHGVVYPTADVDFGANFAGA